MGNSPEPKHKRNWAIWREYRAGGVTLANVGAKHGFSGSRARQIVVGCDKQVLHALRRRISPATEPLPDHMREGLLGVEFTFRADDPWNPFCGYGDWVNVDNSWFQITIGAKR